LRRMKNNGKLIIDFIYHLKKREENQ